MAEYCDKHCLMEEHVKEAPNIRGMVTTHEESIKNMKADLGNITKKVDTLVWKVIGVNVGSIVAIIATMKGLGL